MAIRKSVQKASKSTNATSLIGIFIGTSAAIAAQINPGAYWSKILVIMAPALGFAGDKVSVFIFTEWEAIFERLKTKKQHEQITDFLKNPNTSVEHKAELTRQMEALESAAIKKSPALFNIPILKPAKLQENEILKIDSTLQK